MPNEAKKNLGKLNKEKYKKSGRKILEGKEIHKYFKIGKSRVHILKGVDITIKSGDFVILFGSSGCGKSTLLNTLLGLEIPTSGSVSFMGINIYNYDEDDRSQIRKEGVGLIYQQQNWIKSLSVIENVAFPLTLKGVMEKDRKSKALKLLEMVGMTASAEQAPTELSSGQQQKVSFARALISDPAIVVADEPTGNLDSKSGLELMNLFKTYNEDGKTVVMVTHDLGFLDYASRALNMSDGLIVAEYKRGDSELEKFKVSNTQK